ncbi:MAG TPA: oxidoreductase [Marmoricola sp.]|nr:oxidoreductase [Marmoricola sp.]
MNAPPGWTAADLPDLAGRTAVVTGANSGIGRSVARELAGHGATVVLACRSVERGREAALDMRGTTRVEPLDLASLASVRAFADRWHGPLDLLVNNAGVMWPPTWRQTEDGSELQFGTNHLGHFALTGLLLPHLLRARAPRVVTVASIAHHHGRPSVLEGNPRRGYRPERAYANTKLANLLFFRELHRRCTETGSPLVSTAAHPGVAATNLTASPDGLGRLKPVRVLAPFVTRALFQSADAGADPVLYAATEAPPGTYWGPRHLRESRGPVGPAALSPLARDDELARRLWALSVDRTGVDYAQLQD